MTKDELLNATVLKKTNVLDVEFRLINRTGFTEPYGVIAVQHLTNGTKAVILSRKTKSLDKAHRLFNAAVRDEYRLNEDLLDDLMAFHQMKRAASGTILSR